MRDLTIKKRPKGRITAGNVSFLKDTYHRVELQYTGGTLRAPPLSKRGVGGGPMPRARATDL